MSNRLGSPSENQESAQNRKEKMTLTRKILEELANVSDLVELHESNLRLLQDYEVRLVNYYQEIISSPAKSDGFGLK